MPEIGGEQGEVVQSGVAVVVEIASGPSRRSGCAEGCGEAGEVVEIHQKIESGIALEGVADEDGGIVDGLCEDVGGEGGENLCRFNDGQPVLPPDAAAVLLFNPVPSHAPSANPLATSARI